MNKIHCLIPDMPTTEALIPWLKKIDENRWYSNFGPLVQQFEHELKQLMSQLSVDVPVSVCTTSSGTAAIEVAILAHELPQQGRVLIPGLTFPGTINAIIQAECEPVITDIDRHTWCLTPKIAKGVFAHQPFDLVMPVATYGHPLNIAEWQLFHQETGIPVLIDAAGAFGYQQTGEGITVVFSMHATKSFGVGEGGCVVSVDEPFIQNVRDMTNFGFSDGLIRKWGTNAKMSEYHAAVGLVQLQRWPEMKRKRRTIYDKYLAGFSKADGSVGLQCYPKGSIPSVLTVDTFMAGGEVVKALLEYNIEVRRWYCPPLNRHDAYRKYKTVSPGGYPKLPVVERLSSSLVSLPYHNFLKNSDIEFICKKLQQAQNG